MATPSTNDAYTGLLALSLGAMILGCILLAVDYTSYPDAKPSDAPPPVNIKQQQPPAGQLPAKDKAAQ